MLRHLTLLLTLLALSTSVPGAAQELLTNGSFTDDTLSGWQRTGNVYITRWPAGDPRGVSLVLGYDDNADQRMWQDVTIPAGSTAVLRYSHYVTTDEVSHPYDELDIQLLETSGAPIKLLETITDGSPTGVWTDRVVDVSAYAGRRVRLELHGTTDSNTETQFLLDDFSLVATPAASGPRLTAVTLANGNDQVTTQFRPGDTFRVYADFENVTAAATLTLEARFFSLTGVDQGGAPIQMNVTPAAPRGRVDFSVEPDSVAEELILRLSFTGGGRTDSIDARFAIVTAATTTVTLSRVYTADGNGAEKAEFQPGDAIRLSVLAETATSQKVTLAFRVLDGAGTAIEALSGSGEITLEPGAPLWYLPATVPASLPGGTYRYLGSVTAGGQTSTKETTFRIGAAPTGTTTSCDRPRSFVSDTSNVERASYAVGTTIRLHACVITPSTTAVQARIRFQVDDPQGVASPLLSGLGAVRATANQADWWIPRTVTAALPSGTYTLRAVIEMQGATSTYQSTFRIGTGGLPSTPELVETTGPIEPRTPRRQGPITVSEDRP